MTQSCGLSSCANTPSRTNKQCKFHQYRTSDLGNNRALVLDTPVALSRLFLTAVETWNINRWDRSPLLLCLKLHWVPTSQTFQVLKHDFMPFLHLPPSIDPIEHSTMIVPSTTFPANFQTSSSLLHPSFLHSLFSPDSDCSFFQFAHFAIDL